MSNLTELIDIVQTHPWKTALLAISALSTAKSLFNISFKADSSSQKIVYALIFIVSLAVLFISLQAMQEDAELSGNYGKEPVSDTDTNNTDVFHAATESENPTYSQAQETTFPSKEIVDSPEIQKQVYKNESETWGYATLASSDNKSVEALVLRELTENSNWNEYFDGTNSDIWLKEYPTKSCRVRQTTTITTGREFELFITNNANAYRSRTGDINPNMTACDIAIEEYSQNKFDHMYSELEWLGGNPVFDERVEIINGNSWYVYSGYNSGSGTQDFFCVFFFIDESQKTAVEVSLEYVLFSGAPLSDAAFLNEWYLNLSESLLIR